MTDLPIHAVLPELLAALRHGANAVLVAPPGAGKTTAVAPALLAEEWCTGRILLLSPRRLAARAAAERMAAVAGEAVGGRIGYATRLDAKQSAATRILVLTEGIFRNRVQADPELAGISAVLFDEVHERSLDSDFGLALALDAQAALRPDLRLVAMSATLDGARFGALMAAPVIESLGRSFPVTLCHIGRRAEARIEDEMATAIRRALGEATGGVLAFLPGVAEIERTAERLEELPADVLLHRLHGTLDPAEQRAAIAPAPAGMRKLVLATAIAETSLTLDGIEVVVDSGLARRPRYDRAAGMTRLVTERVSQAAATQRAGRAGRQGPGTAWRLWEAAATAGLPPHDPPEMLEADLSALVLDCAIWGEAEPARLRWLDPPPAAAVAEARLRLASLGAIDADGKDGGGRPTPHGRAMAALPLPPRLAHMLIAAPDTRLAAEVAVLLSERGLGGPDVDLERRLSRWRGERGRRAEAARGLARRWVGMVGSAGEERAAPLPFRGGAGGGASQPRREQGHALRGPTPIPLLKERGFGSPTVGDFTIGACIALAFPDRVARRRDGGGGDWHSVGGRAFRLDPASALARGEWLAVADTGGAAGAMRVLSAAAIDLATIEALFGDRIGWTRAVRFDRGTGAAIATRERRLGALRLGGGPDDAPDPTAVVAALVEGVRAGGLELLPWDAGARALQARAAFAGDTVTDISDAALMAALDDWLPPLLAGVRRLDTVPPGRLREALVERIGWAGRQALDTLTPTHFHSPAGSAHPIDYADPAGPAVELRPQALFGLGVHPVVGRGAPLVLRLTSPAGRPIQTTRDLPGFWAGSWAAVAREMRGRYPRHPWPDDPAGADPTLRTKKGGGRA